VSTAGQQLKGGTRRAAGSLLIALSLAVAMFAMGAIGLLRGGPPRPSGRAATGLLPPPVPVGAASLPQLIEGLQARLRVLSSDWRSFARLGQAYVQEARITADPSFYPKAQGVLQRSLQLHPAENFEGLTGMAALAAARHDFAGALRWGEQAVSLNPYSADARAVVGDAQIELGRYEDAFTTFQKAVDLKPELATYARVSYAWELQGNLPNAVRAMQLALESAGSASDAAWAANQLGELSWNRGQLSAASAWYRQSIERDPTFVPPHAGLAKVAAAQGRLASAIREYRWVVDRSPFPEFVIALGDTLSAAGRKAEAAQQYALVGVEQRLFEASGVNMDLEIALFDADHRVDLPQGLAAARAEWDRRHSIHVADALAWQLYANGRFGEALTYSNEALRLGTRSALFFFHRGMIERALGRDGLARRDLSLALRINPFFSIRWSGTAARTLAALGGSQ